MGMIFRWAIAEEFERYDLENASVESDSQD